MAVHALVTPHLIYANSLLYGINKSHIEKLQVAQNSAARLIQRLKKHDRISHVRKELHWLPIEARIKFKLLNLTWKALNGKAPTYISELLHRNSNTQLRSHKNKALVVPRTLTKFGDRAFSTVAPCLWNSLPVATRLSNSHNAFRRNLKTHLFHNHFLDP